MIPCWTAFVRSRACASHVHLSIFHFRCHFLFLLSSIPFTRSLVSSLSFRVSFSQLFSLDLKDAHSFSFFLFFHFCLSFCFFWSFSLSFPLSHYLFHAHIYTFRPLRFHLYTQYFSFYLFFLSFSLLVFHYESKEKDSSTLSFQQR